MPRRHRWETQASSGVEMPQHLFVNHPLQLPKGSREVLQTNM